METTPKIPPRKETWQHVAVVIDAQVRLKHLGRELRTEYDEVTHEDMPRAIAKLLAKLEAQGQA